MVLPRNWFRHDKRRKGSLQLLSEVSQEITAGSTGSAGANSPQPIPSSPVDWEPAGFRLIIWFGPPTECGWQVQYHFDVVRSAQTRGPPAEIRSEWGRGFAAIEPTNVHDNKFCEEDSQLMTSWMSVSSEITQMPSLALRAHHCSYCIWSHEKNMQKRRKFFD